MVNKKLREALNFYIFIINPIISLIPIAIMKPKETEINKRIVTICDVEFSLKRFLKFNLCKDMYDTALTIRKIPKKRITR